MSYLAYLMEWYGTGPTSEIPGGSELAGVLPQLVRFFYIGLLSFSKSLCFMHNFLPAHLFSSADATDAERELGKDFKGYQKRIFHLIFFMLNGILDLNV